MKPWLLLAGILLLGCSPESGGEERAKAALAYWIQENADDPTSFRFVGIRKRDTVLLEEHLRYKLRLARNIIIVPPLFDPHGVTDTLTAPMTPADSVRMKLILARLDSLSRSPNPLAIKGISYTAYFWLQQDYSDHVQLHSADVEDLFIPVRKTKFWGVTTEGF